MNVSQAWQYHGSDLFVQGMYNIGRMYTCPRYSNRVEMWSRQQNVCVNEQAGVSAAASFSSDCQDGWWYECFTDCPTKLSGIGWRSSNLGIWQIWTCLDNVNDGNHRHTNRGWGYECVSQVYQHGDLDL